MPSFLIQQTSQVTFILKIKADLLMWTHISKLKTFFVSVMQASLIKSTWGFIEYLSLSAYLVFMCLRSFVQIYVCSDFL